VSGKAQKSLACINKTGILSQLELDDAQGTDGNRIEVVHYPHAARRGVVQIAKILSSLLKISSCKVPPKRIKTPMCEKKCLQDEVGALFPE
jgi:hypothetical protein